MRIAIPTDGEFVAEHFGRCPIYTIVNFDDGKMVDKKKLENPGHTPGSIPKFLSENNAECIVCGGIGSRAIGFFQELNIKVVAGVSGKVDDVISKIEKGTLEGGESFCKPGGGKGYGVEKEEEGKCEH